MFYNNYLNRNNVTDKITISRTYISDLCIIKQGIIYTSDKFNISRIHIQSNNADVSGDYEKSSTKSNLWIKGNYQASYNFGNLVVVHVLTNDVIEDCVLEYIKVTGNNIIAGNYYKRDISTWVKENENTTILHQKIKTTDDSITGELTFDKATNIYTNNDYQAYYSDNKWFLQNKSNQQFITPINVYEHDNILNFSNLISCQSNVTVRNTIYEHARLHVYEIDQNYDENEDVEYLNLCVSSNLNLHNNVILNKTRRKDFKGSLITTYAVDDSIGSYFKNEQNSITNEWYEHVYNSNGLLIENKSTKLKDQYTRTDGTAITDYLQSFVKTINGSLISNNNLIYLYEDNMYKKFENVSDDFYNLPSCVIGGTKATGGTWYKSYDKFYSRQLIQQLNTYAEYSKLMLNNGNIPYWDVRDGRGLFYESGAIVFQCGYNETITNFTDRVVSFIKSLPTNLNGCEITFVFMSYGDSENVHFAGSLYFENFYNGTIRIVGLSQNKTKLISNDYKKPVVVFNNVDKIYIDNMSFDYNLSLNGNTVYETNSGVLQFNNVNSIEILESEVGHMYAPGKYNSTSIVTCCGVDLMNSNITLDGFHVKRCYSVIRATDNSKVNVNSIQLEIDSINKQSNYPSIKNNWKHYFKYFIELYNNSCCFANFGGCVDRVVGNDSVEHFIWVEGNNQTGDTAVKIEIGSFINHTHVGLNPIYYISDNGSLITPLNNKTQMNEYTGGDTEPLNAFFDKRINNTSFAPSNSAYVLNNVTLDNLHFYNSVDYSRSQLPIGELIEWLSINTYADGDNEWENDQNMWPHGFYPCWYKYYPSICHQTIDGKDLIVIPINGHDVNDYFYNVPLAIKMRYLVNSSNDDNFVKNYFAIPNVKPILVYSKTSGDVTYYVRKIKLIKYSEKVEYRKNL